MGRLLNDDSTYQTYSAYQVKDIPIEHLKHLVFLFAQHASLNMGANLDKANVDRMIEIISEDYSDLPAHQVASAFSRGSMGFFGEGRLIPKNVNTWLKETKIDFNRWQEHKERENSLKHEEHFSDLMNCPFGKAIMKKIDWELTEEEWDKVPLKMLAEMIGRGEYVTMRDFGIKR